MKFSKVYLALCLTVPTVANAAEKNTIQLEQISVSATRDPSSYAQITNNISKIESNTLRQKQPTSVADALKNLVNVDIAGGQRAIAQKPLIRGLSGNRVAQVIDGVKQNFDLAHRGSYFLPASLIQEIEVVKGPASTLWGSSAIGGVVAIKTPNALDLLKSGETSGVKLRQGYQSANSLSESEISAYAANDKFDALISGYYNDADQLRLAHGKKLPDSAYSQKGGLIKLGWQIDEGQRLELSHRLSKAKQTAPSNNEAISEFTNEQINQLIAEFHRNNPPPPSPPSMPGKPPSSMFSPELQAFLKKTIDFYNSISSRLGSVSYLSEQKISDQSTALNYYLTPENNPYVNAQATLYHNQTIEKESRVFSGLKDVTKLTTQGINLRNSSFFDQLNLTYGVDYAQDHAQTERGTNAKDGKFRPNPYDATSQSTGVYLIAHLPLFNEKVIFSPSIRYDHFKSQSAKTKYTEHNWSTSANLTWKATNWLDLTALYNEAFRAPSLQERFVSGAHFGLNGSGGGGNGGFQQQNVFKANPNLKAEIAQNKEITARLHVDNVFSQDDKFQLSTTYFQNDVKDFIQLEVFKEMRFDLTEFVPKISQYQNIANARLRGFELETQYQTNRLDLAFGYGQTRGKDKNTQQYLSNIAADKFTVAINYELVKDKFTVGSRVSHYRPQNRVPQNHAVTYAGYTLTDISATYAPLKGEWSNLRIDFAIENLFDKKYQPAFSLIEGSGRNVKLSLGYRF
ncbi:ligand-gated channel [Canicola haemoglobinophilus]|uniref:Heme-hemopexin utilization protein C n=1 Tax=Canicola haemoglobinophilus TaxID=733 RepID=A0A1V4B074_9PAST|nr:TonB-dependent hemoglobin/transferrin/lactoferrin family receptor [Canicola haemoglobinophilus]OOR99489.1 ligand-gated channel [Canicola haemoglobinophilus]STO59731.1 heme-hemopexin utilization protein C [Canicola haemoglobinophilus]